MGRIRSGRILVTISVQISVIMGIRGGEYDG